MLTHLTGVVTQQGRNHSTTAVRASSDSSGRIKLKPATQTSSVRHIAHILPTIYKGKPTAKSGGHMKKIFFATGNSNKLKEASPTTWGFARVYCATKKFTQGTAH